MALLSLPGNPKQGNCFKIKITLKYIWPDVPTQVIINNTVPIFNYSP